MAFINNSELKLKKNLKSTNNSKLNLAPPLYTYTNENKKQELVKPPQYLGNILKIRVLFLKHIIMKMIINLQLFLQ